MKIDPWCCRPNLSQYRDASWDDLVYIKQVCTAVHQKQQDLWELESIPCSHVALTAGLVVEMGGSLRTTCIAVGYRAVEVGGFEAWNRLNGRIADPVCEGIWALMPPADERNLPWADRKRLHVTRIRACTLMASPNSPTCGHPKFPQAGQIGL